MTTAWIILTLAARTAYSGEPPSYPLAKAPAEWSAAIQAAEEAMQALQSRLLARLTAELSEGGAARAIDVCRLEAQALTERTRREKGFELGRTSHRLRNPANAPRAWMKPFVAAAQGKKAEEVAAVAVDLGERIGVLKPIPAKGMCLQCHGRAESLAPKLMRKLRKEYPQDKAVGFAEGDLRGFAWAELAKAGRR